MLTKSNEPSLSDNGETDLIKNLNNKVSTLCKQGQG